MNDNIINIADFRPENLIPGTGSFELRLGGTTYEVTTHFDPKGRQSVLEQFMELLRSADLS